MTKKRILFASTALTVFLAAPAMADDVSLSGWYVGGSAGANWLDDESALTTGGGSVDGEFDTGWAILGNVGYGFADTNLRAEFELGYRKNDVDSVRLSGGAALPNPGGEVKQTSAMINVLFDFPVGDELKLSIGGGVGMAEADYDANAGVVPFVRDSDDDWSFAYQAIAGLSMDLSNQAEVFLEYRYFSNRSQDVVTLPIGAPLTDEVDFENHTATIGIRYFLEPAAAPMAQETPPPASMPVTNFTINFGFNKANLSQDGQQVVVEAANSLRSGAATITIEAQGTGDAKRDQELSERRGAAVKGGLVNLGVPADKVSVVTQAGGGATVSATQ